MADEEVLVHASTAAINFATFVFLDFEATGLLGPRQRPRITELCLLAVQREDLLSSSDFPRVVNKLTLIVNPKKSVDYQASIITGLYNDVLELQNPFTEDTVNVINLFLKHLRMPVCVLAHNGHGYDFPLLVTETRRVSQSLSDDIYCADSLQAFRAIDGLDPHIYSNQKNTSSSPSAKSVKDSVATSVSHQSPATLGHMTSSSVECSISSKTVPCLVSSASATSSLAVTSPANISSSSNVTSAIPSSSVPITSSAGNVASKNEYSSAVMSHGAIGINVHSEVDIQAQVYKLDEYSTPTKSPLNQLTIKAL